MSLDKAYATMLAVPLVILPWLCRAQEKTDSLTMKTLSEVVITATKFEIPLKKTSRPVQIITRQDILQSGAQDLAQVLQQQSGIIVNGSSSNLGLNKNLYVRGATNEFTSILIDGVPINDPSGIGGALDLRLLPLGQVERIEIMKGSQSSLYGSGAVSGVINLITKKGGKDRIHVNGNFSLGSFKTNREILNVEGSTSILDYNIEAQHFFSEGISEAKPRLSNVYSDKDKFMQAGAMANFSIKPTKNISIKPYIRFTKNEGDFDGGAFLDADTNRYSSEFINTGGVVNYKKKRIKSRVSCSYTQIDRVFFYPTTEYKFKGRLLDFDGYASYDLYDMVNLSGGLNYQGQQMKGAKGDIEDPFTSIFSAYWNVIVSPFSDLIMELSYRFNVHSQYGVNHMYSIAPAYWVTENIKAFASYNTGYKAPTLSQLYGQFGANESLKPQVSTSWEVGGQFHLINGKLQAMATYYSRNIEDLIIYGNTGYINRDLQQNSGVETSVNWLTNNKLTIKLTYDFMTGRVIMRDQTVNDSTYNNLIRRPEHSFKATVTYRPVPEFFINLNGQYIGRRKDIFFEGFIAKSIELQPYFLLNSHLEYEVLKEKVNIFIDLKNITNADFSELSGYGVLRFGMQFGCRFQL